MNENEKVRRERLRLLVQIDRILDGPMLILGLLWLVLLMVELVWRATPLLDRLTWVLRGVFVVEYLAEEWRGEDSVPSLRSVRSAT